MTPETAARLQPEISFTLSTFNRKTDNRPVEVSFTWTDFCARIEAPDVRADKDGPLFAPARFSPARRLKENVTELFALPLDLDHGVTFDGDLRPWRSIGCAFAAYTTHSHKRIVPKSNPNAEERFRVVLPLLEPIPALYWPAFWQWAQKRSGGKLDEGTKDQSRMLYWPAKASADAEYEYEIKDGNPLNWRELPPLKYAVRAFEEELSKLAAASDGERHNQLFKSSAALGELIAGGVLDSDRVGQALEDAAIRMGFDAAEAKRVSGDGLRRGTKKPRGPEMNGVPPKAATSGPAPVVAHHHVLDSISEKVVEVDFAQLFVDLGLEVTKQKHYLVASIEQLLYLVKDQNYQLARKNDFVFAFNGEFWRQIEREDLKDFLMAVAQKQGIPRLEAKHYEFRDKLYKQFLALASLKTPEPSDDQVLINLLNGTFEITAEKQEIRDFRAADFLTHQLQFKYDKDATAPKFKAYLDRVLPEQELQDIVAEYFGYIFTRSLKLEKALLLYGSGANGKSVLFDIMNALLGKENTANFSLSDLMEEHNRAQIAHKLLNYGSEINASITKDVFKNLVSGEPIMARLKYGNSFLMERYAKLCFNCNELPKDIEQSDAYFRRLLIIPFRLTLPESEWVVDLAQQIIKEELAGVFNWVLDGLKRLLKQKKFTESKIVKNMIAEYRQESDSVACFLRDENWGPDPHDPDHTETLKKIHLSYQSYCRESGHKPLGRNNFKKRLIANRIIEATKAGCSQEFYIRCFAEKKCFSKDQKAQKDQAAETETDVSDVSEVLENISFREDRGQPYDTSPWLGKESYNVPQEEWPEDYQPPF